MKTSAEIRISLIKDLTELTKSELISFISFKLNSPMANHYGKAEDSVLKASDKVYWTILQEATPEQLAAQLIDVRQKAQELSELNQYNYQCATTSPDAYSALTGILRYHKLLQ